MTTININWHYVFEGALLLALVFCVVVCATLAIAYLTGGKPAVKKVVTTVEADVVAAARSPLGKQTVADVESIAAAVAAKLQAAPPVDVPNHPAVTAVIDMVQDARTTKETLAKVAALTAQASATATAPAAAK